MSHQTTDIANAGGRSGDLGFDRMAQRHHAAALAAMSPPTLARLRASRHAATSAPSSRPGLGWWLASGGGAAVLALALAVQLQREPAESTAPLQVAAAAADAELDPALATDDYRSLVAGLDENPDLYLWLAANDEARPGAMTP